MFKSLIFDPKTKRLTLTLAGGQKLAILLSKPADPDDCLTKVQAAVDWSQAEWEPYVADDALSATRTLAFRKKIEPKVEPPKVK